MRDQVFADPMIRTLGNDFVWVMINTVNHKDIKKKFDQHTYPTLILMNTDKSVSQKLEGFRPSIILRKEIRWWSGQTMSGNVASDMEQAHGKSKETGGFRG